MKKIFIAVIALLLSIPTVGGAVVHGTVYSWENLRPLPKAIVTINTTPEQRLVTKNGTYSFTVPPGTYVIRAYYYKNGELELYDEENITVKGNGSYVLDLILFPPLNVSEDIPKIQISLEENQSRFPIATLILPIAFSAVIAAFVYARRRGKAEASANEELPEDLRIVVDVIRREGGRITQKELRKKLGYSEAKISLMLSDLERRGIIEKVKKGRGNVIFLKDDKR